MSDSYWGLQQPAFSSRVAGPSLAASPVHAEALARLDFLRESRLPLGLLLGPAGSGKSSVLAAFAERAGRDGALVASASAAADEVFVLSQIAIGLQVAGCGTAELLWRRIADRLEEIKLEGLSSVVLLDDLDRATASVLSMVERLVALGGEAVTIVASCGASAARQISPRLLELASLRIDLSAWSQAETGDYLTTSLANAGRQQPAFEEEAARRIFELSGGSPRRVNQLAQLALVVGADQKLIQIDAETVEAVQEELAVAR